MTGMGIKLRWMFALLLAFGSAGGATSHSEKLQLVYRGEEGGPWKVFVFGTHCIAPNKVRVLPSKDSTEPLEIECYEP